MSIEPDSFSGDQTADRALELFRRALVWDNVWPVDLKGWPRFGNDWDTLSRFSRAGVGVIGITLAGDNQNASQALELVAWARRQVFARNDQLYLVQKMDDVKVAARAEKKRLGVVFQFEGARCFERNIDLLEVFSVLGVKQTLLAFNVSNSIGGGCTEENESGLTRLGKRFVEEMQRVGMIVDLSHVGYRTSLDALSMARRPMVFSHSNAYAVHPSVRNVRDEQVRECARIGGLVGISGSSEYLGDRACSTDAMFRHLDHFVQMVGARHVGIGLDSVFDAEAVSRYVSGRPEEWPFTTDSNWEGFRYAMPEQLLELTRMMISRGYNDADVLNILGGNYVRVCSECWR